LAERLLQHHLHQLEIDYQRTIGAENTVVGHIQNDEIDENKRREQYQRVDRITAETISNSQSSSLSSTSSSHIVSNQTDFAEDVWNEFESATHIENLELHTNNLNGIYSDDEIHASNDFKTQYSKLHPPLTSTQINTILSVMSTINLPSPFWATNIRENEWKQRIIADLTIKDIAERRFLTQPKAKFKSHTIPFLKSNKPKTKGKMDKLMSGSVSMQQELKVVTNEDFDVDFNHCPVI